MCVHVSGERVEEWEERKKRRNKGGKKRRGKRREEEREKTSGSCRNVLGLNKTDHLPNFLNLRIDNF